VDENDAFAASGIIEGKSHLGKLAIPGQRTTPQVILGKREPQLNRVRYRVCRPDRAWWAGEFGPVGGYQGDPLPAV
jgi:hypothetical protein